MKTSTHLSAVLVVAFVAGIYCDRDSVRSAPEDEHAGGLPFRRDRTGRQPRQLSWSSWSRRDSAPPHIGQVSTAEEDKFRKGIKFQLYTRENPEEPDLIDVYNYDEPNLRHFDAGRPTKVITHGWWTDGVGLVRLRKAFLDAMDVNLIAVDWTGVDTLFYPTARSHVTQIGQRLAYLLDLLRMARGVPLSSVHLIGHSMGAHVVGVAGKMVQWGAVGRITGLDPAGPLFATDPARRLNASDALFVDVIHTCANVLGYSDSLGHADFYPNGGVCVQPGCTLLDLTRGTCSHNRGFDYLEESIRLGSSFKAYPCKGASRTPDLSDPTKAVAMGLVVSTEANGAYCLATRDKSPFALNYEEQKKALLEIRKHGNKLNPSLHHFLIDSDDSSLTTVESPEEDNEVGAATGDRLRDRAILRAFLKRGTDYISRRLRRPKTPENKSF